MSIFVHLAPLYLTSVLLVFIFSKKWQYDKILLISLISTVFCLLSFSLGNTILAITIICVSNTVLVGYSMFFRRRKNEPNFEIS